MSYSGKTWWEELRLGLARSAGPAAFSVSCSILVGLLLWQGGRLAISEAGSAAMLDGRLTCLESGLGQLRDQVKDLRKDFTSGFDSLRKEGKSDLGPLREEVNVDLGSLQKEVTEVKEAVGSLQKDVAEVKEDVGSLREEVAEVKDDLRKVQVRVEENAEMLARIDEKLTSMLQPPDFLSPKLAPAGLATSPSLPSGSPVELVHTEP